MICWASAKAPSARNAICNKRQNVDSDSRLQYFRPPDTRMLHRSLMRSSLSTWRPLVSQIFRIVSSRLNLLIMMLVQSREREVASDLTGCVPAYPLAWRDMHRAASDCRPVSRHQSSSGPASVFRLSLDPWWARVIFSPGVSDFEPLQS